MEIATFLSIAAGQPYLLSYWLKAGILAFPSGFPIPSKNFPEAIQEPLGISQRLSYTLLAVPCSCQIAFKSISQRQWAKNEQFLIISNEAVFLHF
jgi:hypothetical protein